MLVIVVAEDVKPAETGGSVRLYEGLPAGLVDPGCGWQLGRLGAAVPKPVGVGGIGGVQGGGALGADLSGGAEVHRGRGVQPDPGVAVLMVVVMRVIVSRAAFTRRRGRAGRGVRRRSWFERFGPCWRRCLVGLGGGGSELDGGSRGRLTGSSTLSGVVAVMRLICTVG